MGLAKVASGLTPVLAPGRPALYYSPNIGGRVLYLICE